MKTAIILRFIELNRKMGNPGFDDTDIKLIQKFDPLSNNELLAMFELMVTNAHHAGVL